jgi:aryl-alcohol dehydrogenase-like predicted oxidoreductase
LPDGDRGHQLRAHRLRDAAPVAAARDAGLQAIDTSDNYAAGESERMVGRLIGSERERWLRATKAAMGGPHPSAGCPVGGP